MKHIVVSFLFFIFCNYAFCKANLNNAQKKDSLQYYYSLANNPKTSLDLANAYVFFNKKKEESIKRNDTITTINHLRQLAIIQNELGDYYGCETTIVLALKYLDALKVNEFSTQSKVGLYNQLGRLYLELLDYEASLKYFNEGLKITKSKDNINIIKNNMALVYMKQLNFELAEKQLLEVYKNSVSIENPEQLARALDNLGYVQSKLSRPEAIEKLNKALKTRIEIQDKSGTYSSYKHLTQFYKDRNDIDKALYYANKALNIAKSINSASFIEDALSNIISLSVDPNVLEYQRLKDSLDNANQIVENKYALVKYNYLEQEQIANENKLQKEKEKSNRILFQALGILVALISVFTIIILKSKHKKDKIQQVYITETRISKKVHDEVANDVYQVMSKLQGNANIKNEIFDDLENLYARARDISKENGTLDVNDHYEILLNDLLLSYKNSHVNIITRGIPKIGWNSIDPLKKITLYRIIQELMVNMKKHSQATNVALTFNESNNKINVTYIDNGKGCKIKKGTGLLNMENRIKSIKGTIIFESEINKGFKAKITI